MTTFFVAVLLTSVGAGTVGAVLGLGGGILLVPILTIFFGVDLRYAMGASIISVIATSSGAAAGYLRTGLSNVRIGFFLVMATTSGALTGALPDERGAGAMAGVYFTRGDIHPLIVAPVVIGVLVGAYLGTAVMARMRNTTMRKAFRPVVIYLALSMVLGGLGIHLL